jgi:hypothetical protein
MTFYVNKATKRKPFNSSISSKLSLSRTKIGHFDSQNRPNDDLVDFVSQKCPVFGLQLSLTSFFKTFESK